MRVEKKVTVTLEGREEIVDRILAVLLRAQHLGSWGCSRTICFQVDGDGIDRLKTDIPRSAARHTYETNLYRPGQELFDYDCNVVTDEPRANPQPHEKRESSYGVGDGGYADQGKQQMDDADEPERKS